MSKLIGILGFGSIGERHAASIQKLGHQFKFHDPNIKGKKNGIEFEIGFSRDNVLDDCDAIIIATPTGRHYDDLMDALATKKPVFCEKPLANVAHMHFSRVMMVGYNLRFHPCVIKAKEWMDARDIGGVLWANFSCCQYNSKYTDHVILNWSHEIDLATYLLGSAYVTGSATSGPSIAEITLRHDNGILSQVHLDYVTVPWIRQFIIVGDNGSIICDLKRRQAWLRAPEGEILEHFADKGSFDDDYLAEMQAFIDKIEFGDSAALPGATGEEGLAVLHLCTEAIRKASK